MKKQLLLVLILCCSFQLQAQNDELWQKVSQSSATNKSVVASPGTDKLFYSLNVGLLKEKLSGAGLQTSKKSNTVITFPNAEGVLEKYTVWESSNFDPELQAKYPEIRAYEGVGTKGAKIHFSLSSIGVQTMVLRANANPEFIEKNPDNKSQYVLFTSKNSSKMDALNCKTTASLVDKSGKSKTAKTASNTKVFKTLRLALSCTGEYTAYFGGTKAGALAGMNATMTRVNGIFNRDLALKLILIANNDAVIYTDAATDPYSDADDGADGAWNQEVQNALTSKIGNSGYDIGHLFGASGGGGNAGCIGCICENPTSGNPLAKGSAYTSPSNEAPEGDTFDIDFVIHEFGHQLGANHTFSYDIEGTDVNVEPGSGTTIMGYAGVSDGYDIQNNSDDYFAYASILQIQDNFTNKTCPVNTTLTNNPPTISAGADYTIPISTAFVLKGTGSDADGDTVTYSWEQYDTAVTTSGSNSLALSDKKDGPLFRSFPPVASATRYMPDFNSVLQNKLTSSWESVPSIGRTLHFTLTGRDNAAQGTAQTNTDSMIVTVNAAAGPFAVTSQNTDDLGWINNTQQTITWSVNNTNTISGATNVNIKLSTDGGLTFPTVLASNTPNDGSQVITVPADIKAKNCRLLIEPTNNIFYAVNSKQFAVGYNVTTKNETYTFTAPFEIPERFAYTTRIITVPTSSDAVFITDVNLNLKLTHAYLSDVQIDIVSPKGTVVKLFERSCGSTENTLVLNYDDAGDAIDCEETALQVVIPEELLSAFNDESPYGNWTLRVRDNFDGDTGTIDAASITIQTQQYTLGVSDFDLANFALFPNPNKGNFTVQFDSNTSSGVTILVHDFLGRKIYENEFQSTARFNQNIQLPAVQSGTYIVKILDGDREITRKIIVN
ncbi:T9SS type A sorting domain-containing protein [Flavobacterium sp. GA093]|uniref:T9SS type A sorting domain-containing protein n=1 Tax=Flavobacterium hydrocarbonoxydans TaxID=2683249 RepID=A0A6I4NHG0_9FLAO|nr:zinc-dependent metalloprotease family protein [Flavobacterium hydrocarbonoxydans]MWB93611.1 T9SS type A sorting domain-containing protein [Flavobacterium hydrocarbonoxydans]